MNVGRFTDLACGAVDDLWGLGLWFRRIGPRLHHRGLGPGLVGDVAGLLSELLEEEDLGGAPLELCHILPSRPSSLGYQVPGCLGP